VVHGAENTSEGNAASFGPAAVARAPRYCRSVVQPSVEVEIEIEIESPVSDFDFDFDFNFKFT
jgi:hypothetical protein